MLAKYNGIADKGGKNVRTTATALYELMETYPGCTITVYNAGTTTPASIFVDAAGNPKANPFTADAVDASFFFYAAGGVYDIKLSGTGIVTPFTISNVVITDASSKLDYNIGDYNSFSEAVDAMPATGATLVINQPTPAIVNKTIPNYVTLKFTGKGELNLTNGVTLTPNGPIEAGIRQIFVNALGGGQGTVSFANNSSISEIYPEWWGAIADATSGSLGTDSTGALNAAFAQAGRIVRLMKGGYRFISNLPAPICTAIIGSGKDDTILYPSSAITAALTARAPATQIPRLEEFCLDGTATTNAIGLTFGDTIDGWAGRVKRVRVKNFTGASGVGIRIGFALKTEFIGVTVQGCGTNLVMQRFSTFPSSTTLTFRNCQFVTSTVGPGAKVADGMAITFDGTVFESNAQEGLLLNNTNLPVYVNLVNGCWFESNYESAPTNYNFRVTCGTEQVHVRIDGMHVQGHAKVALFDGTLVSFKVDEWDYPDGAAQVLVQNGAFGFMYIPFYVTDEGVNAAFSDTAGYTQAFYRGVIKFPPTQVVATDVNSLDSYKEGTFSPTISLGSGSATYTGNGNYTKVGRHVIASIVINISAVSGPGGTLRIAGLPFTNIAAETSVPVSVLNATDNTIFVGFVDASATTVYIVGQQSPSIDVGAKLQAGTVIRIMASYNAAN